MSHPKPIVGSETGPFYGTPFHEQEREAVEWLEAGNRPEQHPAVKHFKDGPPRNAAFEILSPVSVRSSWGDQSKIHCNICNRQHQFIDDGFVASYDDGYWYIVGPDCGSVEHRARRGLAQQSYKNRVARRVADERLVAFADDKDSWRLRIGGLEPVVACAARFERSLQNHCPTLHRLLGEARARNGELRVAVPTTRYRRDGSDYTVHAETTLVRLTPSQAIGAGQRASVCLRAASKTLAPLLAEANDIYRSILNASEKNQINAMQRDVYEALRNIELAEAELSSFRELWTENTFRDIEAWAKHPGSNYRYALQFTVRFPEVEFTGEARGRHLVDLSPLQ